MALLSRVFLSENKSWTSQGISSNSEYKNMTSLTWVTILKKNEGFPHLMWIHTPETQSDTRLKPNGNRESHNTSTRFFMKKLCPVCTWEHKGFICGQGPCFERRNRIHQQWSKAWKQVECLAAQMTNIYIKDFFCKGYNATCNISLWWLVTSGNSFSDWW